MLEKNYLTNKMQQVAFLALLSILAVLSYLIAKPFLIPIISGALLAFVFHPLYKIFVRRIRNKSLSAIITVIIILFFIAIPILFVGNSLAKETAGTFITLNDRLNTGNLFPDDCKKDTFVCRTNEKIKKALENPETRSQITRFSNSVIGMVAEKIGLFIISIPSMILSIAIALFATFYFIRDGGKFADLLKRIAPVKQTHQQALMKQLKDTIKALVYGIIIVAIIQGMLATLGFIVFGVPNAILWGTLTVFFAMIPFVGAWLVWFPASIYLFLTGYALNQTSIILKSIGLAVFGGLIVSQIDNFLKPVMVGGKAKVHPILILIGVLGGLMMFGVIGIFLGPIILAILQKVVEIYLNETNTSLKSKTPAKDRTGDDHPDDQSL